MTKVMIRVMHTVDVEVDAEYGDTPEVLLAKVTPDMPRLDEGISAELLRPYDTGMTLLHPQAAEVLGYTPDSEAHAALSAVQRSAV
jgi:hypothetical protein